MTTLLNPERRAVMRALTERGHYAETPNDFDWAVADSGTVMDHVDAMGLSVEVLRDALLDTGMHNIDHSTNGAAAGEAACLRLDIEAILAALDDG